MGYVHDVNMSAKVSLEKIKTTVGTWAIAAASNVWSLNHTAAADVSVNHIPIDLPFQDTADTVKGAKLTSVDIWYTVGTADVNDMTMVLQKVTLPATGGAVPTVSTPAVTYDSNHDTAAKRKANGATMHKMTITLTTPIWVGGSDEVYVENTCDAAASSVVKIYAVRANFTLRL